MELAGLNIVMTADFGAVFSSFTQAETYLSSFADTIKNTFNGIPDLGKRLTFTSNGASQAAQDTRELANARLLDAQAALTQANASKVTEQQQERKSRSNKKELDEYGQLVAQNQLLVRQYYNAVAALVAGGVPLDKAIAKFEELRLAAKDGQDQLAKIEQGVGRFQRQVGNYATGTAALAQQLRQITTEIPNFFQSARIGFQSLSNNLPGIFNELVRIREANIALAASGQPTVSVFKQFLGAFNPLNIAIGVGVGLLTAYAPKLIDMISGANKNADAIKREKDELEAFNNIQNSANKGAADQIGKLKALQFVMTDSTLSMRQRTIAYNEAVKLYPAYLDGVSKDDALNGALADTINNKLIPAIIAAAKARAYQEKINYLVSQNINLEEQQLKLTKDRANAQLELNKRLQDQRNVEPIDPQAAGLRSSVKRDISAQRDRIDELTDAQNQNAASRIRNNETIDRFTRSLAAATEAAGDLNKAQTEPKPKIDRLPEQLEKIADKIAIEWYKIIQADQKGFDEFAKNQQITRTPLTPSYLSNDSTGEITAYFNDNAKAIEDGAGDTARALQIDLDVWESNNKKIQDAQKKRLEALENFRQQSAAILTDTFAQTAAIIGEGIGSLLSGQQFDLFGSLGKLLAEQIINFGKELIKVGGLMEAIQNAVKALGVTGVPAIIAGFAAVGIGSALKASLNKQQKSIGKFADGGIAYGTTLGVFGEYANARSNPEVVAPLDKLQTILRNSNTGNDNSSSVPLVAEYTIKGQDLLVVMKRAEKAFKR